MGCDVVSAGISLTHACKAVMGQRQIFCVWGLRPMFNSSASTATRCATGNLRQRQRQPQPQWSMPAVAAAGMLACLMLACCVSGEWHACQGGEQARRWSGVGAYRACHSVGSARGRPRRTNIASAMHVCVNTRLSVRVPVHGVGESDRPSRMYSDMKYIFCEYLRPFAAREKHAAERARGRKAR